MIDYDIAVDICDDLETQCSEFFPFAFMADAYCASLGWELPSVVVMAAIDRAKTKPL